MHFRKSGFLVFLALCVLLLASCKPEPVEDPPQQEYSALPQENRQAVNSWEVCPSSAANGFFSCAKAVWFYDADQRQSIALCAQPGCSHQDPVCGAWIGDVMNYTEYHGELYAILDEGGNGVRFVRKNLSDGTVTTLETWENMEGSYYSANLCTIADQMALVTVKCYQTVAEEGVTVEEQTEYWLFDLTSGEKRVLLPNENLEELNIIAISADYFAAIYTPLDQQLLEPEAFAEQYGENANYGRYLDVETVRELRLYDSKTMEYTVIASTRQDRFVRSGDPAVVSGKLVIYQCGDTIYTLNVDTGETTQILTMEGIINYWMMDEKVFLITQNLPGYISSGPELELGFYYADLGSGELHKLENGGNTRAMEFSIIREGEGFFIGNWNGGTCLISKADFYAENYENAVRVG